MARQNPEALNIVESLIIRFGSERCVNLRDADVLVENIFISIETQKEILDITRELCQHDAATIFNDLFETELALLKNEGQLV